MAEFEDELVFKSPKRGAKCLAGVNIMLVDDSRSVSEAVRLMATVSGARLRRADCVASAQRHLMLFRPDVVLTDLSLPDGNGVEVARMVADRIDPKPAVLIVSGAEEDVARQAAEDCGADGYLVKPIDGLSAFQSAVLSVLKGGPVALPEWDSEFSAKVSDSEYFVQDMENALDLFTEAVKENDTVELEFGAQFLAGVASTVGDSELEKCARAVSERLAGGHRGMKAAGFAIEMISARLQKGLPATG